MTDNNITLTALIAVIAAKYGAPVYLCGVCECVWGVGVVCMCECVWGGGCVCVWGGRTLGCKLVCVCVCVSYSSDPPMTPILPACPLCEAWLRGGTMDRTACSKDACMSTTAMTAIL